MRYLSIVRSIGVPVLACGIATGQVAFARLGPLTPWKGGGFGMFATIDTPGTRVLNVRVTDVTGQVHRIEFSDHLRGALSPRQRSRARAYPSQARLRAIAEAVLLSDLAPKEAAETVGGRLVFDRYALAFQHLSLSQPAVEVVGRRDIARSRIPSVTRVDVNVVRPVYGPASSTVRLRSVAGVSLSNDRRAKR
jgi:hypothetical protein